ncbi:MAG TPA: DUF58 domain-containing protein [Polyangiaceae bacterium]|nr:DUF58 domain-containing protein [Polyangiaceae bacterium]
MTEKLRRRLAEHAPGRANLRTRLLAAGLGGGQHRSERRGSGVEFAGHREYYPGDDLRHLDRHALLRHGRHLIREFHSETERALWLVVDGSASMSYRGEGQAESKLGTALLLAGGLALLTRSSADPLGLCLLGTAAPGLPPRAGLPHVEHVLSELDALDALDGGDSSESQPLDADALTRLFVPRLAHVAQRAKRGSTLVVLSDLLDPEGSWWRELPILAGGRRRLVVVQVLDRSEVEFSLRGSLRLRDPESGAIVDTEGERARQGYLRALAAHTDSIEREVASRGGAFLRLITDEPLTQSFLRLRLAIQGAATPFEVDATGGGSA